VQVGPAQDGRAYKQLSEDTFTASPTITRLGPKKSVTDDGRSVGRQLTRAPLCRTFFVWIPFKAASHRRPANVVTCRHVVTGTRRCRASWCACTS
jgi:hypothetical protein